jgi:hypothetical protein
MFFCNHILLFSIEKVKNFIWEFSGFERVLSFEKGCSWLKYKTLSMVDKSFLLVDKAFFWVDKAFFRVDKTFFLEDKTLANNQCSTNCQKLLFLNVFSSLFKTQNSRSFFHEKNIFHSSQIISQNFSSNKNLGTSYCWSLKHSLHKHTSNT